MTVAGEKVLATFGRKHPQALKPLGSWRKLVEYGTFRSLIDLQKTFSDVEFVRLKSREVYVFNIGGNKYRLITAIHFNAQALVVRDVLTHAEYSTERWKTKL